MPRYYVNTLVHANVDIKVYADSEEEAMRRVSETPLWSILGSVRPMDIALVDPQGATEIQP